MRERGGGSSTSGGAAGEPLTGDSFDPSIDTDGSHVAFRATDENGGNTRLDVRVWNRGNGRSERAAAATDGGGATGSSFAPAISGDGQWVAGANAWNVRGPLSCVWSRSQRLRDLEGLCESWQYC